MVTSRGGGPGCATTSGETTRITPSTTLGAVAGATALGIIVGFTNPTAITGVAVAATPPASIILDAGTGIVLSAEDAAQTALLDPAEVTLLNSNQPKTVTLDVATGQVVSVTPANETRLAVTTNDNNCANTTYACTNPKIPFKRWSWGGTVGSRAVDWPGQNGYNTRAQNAGICWDPASGGNVCGGVFRPYTGVTLTGTVRINTVRIG